MACLTIIGSNIVATVESTASQIGHINLNMKRTGKPGAGKPHAGFDEAGAGNGLLSTAPVLDPTKKKERGDASFGFTPLPLAGKDTQN